MLRKLAAGMLYDQARWVMSLGRLGMVHAYRLLRLACALWPAHPEACHWLSYLRGRIAIEHGQPEQAVELLRAADKALPNNPAIRANLGLAYTMAGKHEQAITIFERLLKEDPSQAPEEVWASLAWSYLRTGRAPKAREACMRADEVEVRSLRLDLLHRLATGVGLGSLPVNEVRELLASVPQSLSLLLEYARLQAQEGRHRLARTAVSAMPEDEEARAYGIIARASLNEEDTKTAQWAADQMLRTRDERYFPEALLLRSEVALRRGDLEDAVLQAGRALETGEAEGRAREQLARVLLLRGDWDQAVEESVEALQTGQAGALAAGIAALAALDAGDAVAARGLFLAERHGDSLACAISSAAQAGIFSSENDLAQALEAAGWALDELSHLPQWAEHQALRKRLLTTVAHALEKVPEDGDPEVQATISRLRTKLERLTQS
ncbi:MAG: tetratricopeptide repeat protein [Armatimonadota bacterium]